jgi:hypothetical protein
VRSGDFVMMQIGQPTNSMYLAGHPTSVNPPSIVNPLISHEAHSGRRYRPSSHRIHDASTNATLRRLLRLGMRRKRDGYIYESGKRQESMQHGWLLERLIVIESQASNRACRETCGRRGSSSDKEVTGDFGMVTGESHFHSSWVARGAVGNQRLAARFMVNASGPYPVA